MAGFIGALLPIDKIISEYTVSRNYLVFSVFHTEAKDVGDVTAVGILKQIVPISLNASNTEMQGTGEKSGEYTNNEKGEQPNQNDGENDDEFETESLYTPPTLTTLLENFPDNPPVIIPFGTVCFRNGMHLPVVAIGARYGVYPHPSILPDSSLDTIKFDLPPSQADKLAVFCINNGTVFLAPKNWEVLTAEIGANGMTGILKF